MDKTTQQHSRGFAGTYGDFKALEYLDHIVSDGNMSERDARQAKKILRVTNDLFSAIDFNSQERRFLLWAAKKAKDEMLEKANSNEWDNQTVLSVVKNFISTKHKIATEDINFRPKASPDWKTLNKKRGGLN